MYIELHGEAIQTPNGQTEAIARRCRVRRYSRTGAPGDHAIIWQHDGVMQRKEVIRNWRKLTLGEVRIRTKIQDIRRARLREAGWAQQGERHDKQ